jgi:hypothetical protein
MSTYKWLLLVLVLAAAGCASVQLDFVGSSFPPTSHVDLYFNQEDIVRPHRVMGEASAVAPADSSISASQMQAELVEKAKANGADAILFTELRKNRTGSSSFGGHGRSSSIIHYNLVINGTFLRYTDSEGPPAAARPAPAPAPAPKAAVKRQPAPRTPAPSPTPAPEPEESDDLDRPVSL